MTTWESSTPWPGRAGKTVKGMLVALALVVALEREPDALATLLALSGAVLAFTVGEVYDAGLAEQIRTRRGLLASEFREIVVEQSFICIGAMPAIVIYVFAVAGVIGESVADNVTLWTGIALLGGLGAAAGRLAREPVIRCVVFGFESAVIGALVVVLKALVKEI